MAAEFRFGVVVRGQAEPGEDIARRFEETLSFVRLAHRLGYDSITKTAHYSASPFQMLQLVPVLARFIADIAAVIPLIIRCYSAVLPADIAAVIPPKSQ